MANSMNVPTDEDLEVMWLCHGGKAKEPSIKWSSEGKMEVPIYIGNEVPCNIDPYNMYFIPIERSRENGYASPFCMPPKDTIVWPVVKCNETAGMTRSMLSKKFEELIVSI